MMSSISTSNTNSTNSEIQRRRDEAADWFDDLSEQEQHWLKADGAVGNYISRNFRVLIKQYLELPEVTDEIKSHFKLVIEELKKVMRESIKENIG